MMKDPTEFKQRFKRWQEGEKVYEAGRKLPEVVVTPDAAYTNIGQFNADKYPIVSSKDEGLDDWFRQNPMVTGMAIGGGENGIDGPRRIVHNPYLTNMQGTIQQWKGLDRIEAIRHYMSESGYIPKFDLTEEQKNLLNTLYRGTPYGTDDDAFKKSIVSRIAVGDITNIGTPSKRQINAAKMFSYDAGKPIEDDLDDLVQNEIIPYTPSIDDVEKPGYRKYLWQLAKNRRKAHLEAYGQASSAEDYYRDFLSNSQGSFNYRRWYNTTPKKELLNALNMGTAHWRDADGKTHLSPTFSVESPYSGYKNPYNPLGIIGGSWEGELPNDRYIFSDSQIDNGWDINRTLEEFEWSRANEKMEDGTPINTRAIYKNGQVLPEVIVTPHDKGKSIYINPANKGKFNATKKRTGKTTEQLTHSKNPLTRKRAIFALNSRKWHH